MVSAVTTLALIFLPRFFPAAPDIDTQARLIHNPFYMLRVWVALVHPLVVLVGALGVLYVRFREAPGSAITGFVFFLLWAGAEAVQSALTLVTLNWTWRAAFLSATDETVREVLRRQIAEFDAVWDGLFFFLVIAFIVANVLYMVAVFGGEALQRCVSLCFGLGAALGVISLATSFGGGILPARVMDILYPVVQPAARFATGLWILRYTRGGS
jgi:hypothetical protein